MRKSVIVDPVYGSRILFFHAYDKDKAKRSAEKWLSEKTGENIEISMERCRAVTYGEGLHFVVWIRDACDFRSIVHEAVHVGIKLMKEIGHDVNQGDEPLAYYCDWLVTEAMERL